MNNQEKTFLYGFGGAMAIIALIVWFSYKSNLREKDEQIKELEADKLRLIYDSINSEDNLTAEVKRQLIKLIESHKEVNPNIAKELKTALSLVKEGEAEKGVGCLSIIIENLLKEKYLDDTGFEKWLKRERNKKPPKASQANLIDYAREDKLLVGEEHGFAMAVKDIRNGVFHEAGAIVAKNFKKAGLLVALEIILKLSDSIYHTN